MATSERMGDGGPAMDAGELALFAQTVADFEDCEETTTDYDQLMRWAAAGLLECERFVITEAGYAMLAARTQP